MHSFYLYLYCQILVIVFVPTRVHRILYETARQIFHVLTHTHLKRATKPSTSFSSYLNSKAHSITLTIIIIQIHRTCVVGTFHISEEEELPPRVLFAPFNQQRCQDRPLDHKLRSGAPGDELMTVMEVASTVTCHHRHILFKLNNIPPSSLLSNLLDQLKYHFNPSFSGFKHQ